MIRFLTISALSFAILGACGKKKDEKPAEPAKSVAVEVVAADKAAVPSAAAVLVIKAAKLTMDLGDDNPDGPESIALDDKGNITVVDETVATISADGKVVDMDGKEIARLDADGTMHFAGEEETALIGADGSVTVDGEKVASFDENNMLVMTELDESVKFEGPAEARRAMMVVFLVATMAGDVEEEFVEASADAPAEE